MNYLKVRVYDHTRAYNWQERIDAVNELTEGYADTHIDFDIVAEEAPAIKWRQPEGSVKRHCDKQWFLDTYSRRATDYDVVVANFKDEHWDTPRKNKLGGHSIDFTLGVSEIFMRSTPKQRRTLKKGLVVEEWVGRFLHEMCHSVFDHIMLKPHLDVTHYWDQEKKDLTKALDKWEIRHSKGNMERGIFEDVYMPLPINQSWEGNNPQAIVWHTLWGNVQGSFAHLDAVDLSYHFTIGTDGRRYQLVDLDRSAWHAGVVGNMNKQARKVFGKTNPNRLSVGVALERKGEPELTKWMILSAHDLKKKIENTLQKKFDRAHNIAHCEIYDVKPKEVLGYIDQILSKDEYKQPEHSPLSERVEAAAAGVQAVGDTEKATVLRRLAKLLRAIGL